MVILENSVILQIVILCWIIPLGRISPSSTYRPLDGSWCHLNTGLVQLKLWSPTEDRNRRFAPSNVALKTNEEQVFQQTQMKKQFVKHSEKNQQQGKEHSGTSKRHRTAFVRDQSESKRAPLKDHAKEQSNSLKQVWISVKRDGSVWTRLGGDRLAEDWIHDSEKERSYHGAVLKEHDIQILTKLNYTQSCVLSDLDLNIFTSSAWQPSYLVAFDPAEKRNHIVTMKHHKDCSSKALIRISADRQQLHCSYENQEFGDGLEFGTLENEGNEESVIERGVCGHKTANRTLKMETLFLRDFSFDPAGDESWKCRERVDGWNSYRFFGSYYFAFVKVADCPKPTSSTTLGYEPKLRPNWDVEINQALIPDPSQTFLDDAVVVAWEVFVKMISHQHSVYLQVWRPKPQIPDFRRVLYQTRTKADKRKFGSSYVLIGQTFFQPKNLLLQTLNLREEEQIPVKRGDILGFYHPHSNPLAFDFVPCAFLEQLSRLSKLPENFKRPMKPGEEFGFQSHFLPNRTAEDRTLKFPSNRSSDVLCRQYSFVAVLANLSSPERTRSIDDWSCPDHNKPFHLRGILSETRHPSSILSNLHSDDVAVDRKHDEFRSQPSSSLHHHHHHHHHRHTVDFSTDVNETYFTSVIVIIITSCLMVVMFCVGVASYLVATSCK